LNEGDESHGKMDRGWGYSLKRGSLQLRRVPPAEEIKKVQADG